MRNKLLMFLISCVIFDATASLAVQENASQDTLRTLLGLDYSYVTAMRKELYGCGEYDKPRFRGYLRLLPPDLNEACETLFDDEKSLIFQDVLPTSHEWVSLITKDTVNIPKKDGRDTAGIPWLKVASGQRILSHLAAQRIIERMSFTYIKLPKTYFYQKGPRPHGPEDVTFDVTSVWYMVQEDIRSNGQSINREQARELCLFLMLFDFDVGSGNFVLWDDTIYLIDVEDREPALTSVPKLLRYNLSTDAQAFVTQVAAALEVDGKPPSHNPLLAACESNKVEEVRYLCRQPYLYYLSVDDPSLFSDALEGTNLLLRAAQAGSWDVVRLLLTEFPKDAVVSQGDDVVGRTLHLWSEPVCAELQKLARAANETLLF